MMIVMLVLVMLLVLGCCDGLHRFLLHFRSVLVK